MTKPKKEEICSFCNLLIKTKDRFVLVGTYVKQKSEDDVIEEKYYHIKCWKKYFQSKILEGMKGAMSKAGSMLGDLMHRLPGSGNGDGNGGGIVAI